MLEACKAKCPGPSKCPYVGTPIFGSNPPQLIRCPVYERWRKQAALEHEIRNVVPENLAEKNFENFLIRSPTSGKALQLMKKYTESEAWKEGANILLTGTYGVGKTHLATATIRKAIEAGSTAALILAVDLIQGNFEEINNRFEKLQKVDLLVIDDLTTEFENKYFLQQIFRLLEHRYRRKKGTVFTTNLPVREFVKGIGDKIFSRLYENLLVIEIKDSDYRKELRRKKLEWFKNS